MNRIESLLNGSIYMDQFLEKAVKDTGLQEQIRGLLPISALEDSSHDFWRVFPLDSVRRNDFDFYKFIFWALQPGRRIGNYYAIYERIKKAYLYHNPKAICTEMYEREFDLYLDVIKDCFDGPEVVPIVDRIFEDVRNIKSKSKRTQYAKKVISEQFHLDKKRPRWVQGPEWPMGKHSPMKYVDQKKTGELVEYFFQDVDTDEMKVVKQYY